MFISDLSYLCYQLSVVFCVLTTLSAQLYRETNEIENKIPPNELKIVWCTINVNETKKCEAFMHANERDQIKVTSGTSRETIKIDCVQAANKDECMIMLDEGTATMTTLDAGEMFVGGRYHSLVPIAQEVMEGGFNYYYSVAVVKAGSLSDVTTMHNLRGKRACFAGVETYAGWMLPISTLMSDGIMDVIDCNNHVKTASSFFGPSCAVNCLNDKYNPIGDNSDKLCKLCVGEIPGRWCTDADPFADYSGAFRCLLDKGEIAFLKHTTIPELLKSREFAGLQSEQFELLCKDGIKRPLSEYQNCNWGIVPSDAIVVSSAVLFDKRKEYQEALQAFAERYSQQNPRESDNDQREPQFDNFGNRIVPDQDQYNQDQYDQYGQRQNQPNSNQYPARYPQRFKRQNYGQDEYRPNNNYNPDYNAYRTDYENDRNSTRERDYKYYEHFNLFESSPRYGSHGNLMFQDAARGIALVPEHLQTYEAFLGKAHEIIMQVRSCPVNTMTMCVTSDVEKDKCVKMKTALKAQLLKPELDCYKGHSQIHCMQAIRGGTADVAVLDASDVYTAGLNYELVPFISEVYNLEDPDYYVVAVAKESDPDTELTYLRTKNTCHGGINTAAGWVFPLAFLISNGWIRPYGCNSIRAAAEYFTKSCVPGAISTEYNTGVPYDNMCDLCHGSSYRYCRRDASEDYYGHTGAFRCLVEGGGQVAFVKHTTVFENTGGKKREWWVRDNLMEDFELLCPDGTRAETNEYRKCNLGKVKANAIVTRGGYAYNETHIDAYINLFMYAQRFYGRKTADEFSFSMFTSEPPYADLIFQDATTQLKIIEPSKRYYSAYLGPDFMRARRIVDCHAAGSATVATIALTLLSYCLIIIVN
ncbi:unnamed protein product [Ceutorhynchus assimilis]|uniref:Transferrin-like domain-containing protein n=1 Tax=Ceutorhynchus assimilis TaxID=467358 RepID=A0A9N9QMV9_9CUCU|nr:unnamed protein product [Ceutorhynchus assimilis]